MKVMQINSVSYGSTGKIIFALSDMLHKNGDSAICATGFTWYKSGRNDNIAVGNIFSKALHMYASKYLGTHGLYSKYATKKLIRKIEEYRPDIIHLHNIHGWYLHIPTLFEYLKKNDIPVVWTLHDCWSFTGGCAHFTYCDCSRWKDGCGMCDNLTDYPISSQKDKTHKMWKLKNKCFNGIANLTIVTPSEWLASLVKQSFLREYPIRVINNGINLDVFKPTLGCFRSKYNHTKKYIVLGVSFGWGKKKGLDVFCDLANKLDNSLYQIVLVGTDEKTDCLLPKSVISIHRTNNQKELAEIYTAADVFVNPTREENYPTVNMESLACGTPVITFKTGGCSEMLDDTCGIVVEPNDVQALQEAIINVCERKTVSEEKCLKKAQEFDCYARYGKYRKLYDEIVSEKAEKDNSFYKERI